MEHYYNNVTGFFNFEDVYTEMVEKFPSGAHFVEVGSFCGCSTVFLAVEILNSGKDIKFDAIDKWDFNWDINGESVSVYENFLENIEPVKSYVTPYKLLSVDAVKNYADESLDFVYIDADHEYEGVKKDIELWLPKVKKGGIIAGHDYIEGWDGVIRAVDEFFGKDNITIKRMSWIYNKPTVTYTIGYPIHNKSHMMDEIINGLIENIKIPVEYIFIFDGCTDDSEAILDAMSGKLIGNVTKIHTENLFQLKTYNLLMKEFKTDVLIMFQDDMVLKDPNFLGNITKINEKYGDELGIIGCRDGFEKQYTHMFSSKFSGSSFEGCKIIDNGEFHECSIVNVGPIAVTRRLVNTVGYFDEIYDIGAYEEMEYSILCKHKYNLKNVILGVDLIHSKFEHKAKNSVKHTAKTELKDQYSINEPIFSQRWEKYWKL